MWLKISAYSDLSPTGVCSQFNLERSRLLSKTEVQSVQVLFCVFVTKIMHLSTKTISLSKHVL